MISYRIERYNNLSCDDENENNYVLEYLPSFWNSDTSGDWTVSTNTTSNMIGIKQLWEAFDKDIYYGFVGNPNLDGNVYIDIKNNVNTFIPETIILTAQAGSENAAPESIIVYGIKQDNTLEEIKAFDTSLIRNGQTITYDLQNAKAFCGIRLLISVAPVIGEIDMGFYKV
jgi:hypothetical protein